jgi:hypothetical protein
MLPRFWRAKSEPGKDALIPASAGEPAERDEADQRDDQPENEAVEDEPDDDPDDHEDSTDAYASHSPPFPRVPALPANDSPLVPNRRENYAATPTGSSASPKRARLTN